MVSIVIPTTDKEKHFIEKSIEYIKRSKYKDYEIIIVNEGLERSEQRNIGIGRAKGDYILLLDSDQYISPCLLSDCVWRMERGYNALYIPEVIITKGFFGRLRNFERSFYTGTPVDCVRFVRKSICPFFDRSMSGPEDADWDRRVIGRKGVALPCLYHEDIVTPLRYLKKKAYYTNSMKRYHEKWPEDKVLDLKYRCWTIFTEGGKWKKIIRHPFMTLGVMILLMLRGVIYLCAKGF